MSKKNAIDRAIEDLEARKRDYVNSIDVAILALKTQKIIKVKPERKPRQPKTPEI
jgi:hypothetical protein